MICMRILMPLTKVIRPKHYWTEQTFATRTPHYYWLSEAQRGLELGISWCSCRWQLPSHPAKTHLGDVREIPEPVWSQVSGGSTISKTGSLLFSKISWALELMVSVRLTEIELQLLTAVLFVKRGIRGVISRCSNRYSPANNTYDEATYISAEESRYIMYPNNL